MKVKRHIKAATKALEEKGLKVVALLHPFGDDGNACIVAKGDGMYRFCTLQKAGCSQQLDNETLGQLEKASMHFFSTRDDYCVNYRFDLMVMDKAEGVWKVGTVIRDWPNSSHSAVEYGHGEISGNVPPEMHAKVVQGIDRYLEEKGWTVIETGWTGRYGTVDLVALDVEGVLVLVEVRVCAYPGEGFPQMPKAKWNETRTRLVAEDYVRENAAFSSKSTRYDAFDVKVVADHGAALRMHHNVFEW